MDFKSLKKTLIATGVSIALLVGAYNVGLSQRLSYKQLSTKAQQEVQANLTSVNLLVSKAFERMSIGDFKRAIQMTVDARIIFESITQMTNMKEDGEYKQIKTMLSELIAVASDSEISQIPFGGYDDENYCSEFTEKQLIDYANRCIPERFLHGSINSPENIKTQEVQLLAFRSRLVFLREYLGSIIPKVERQLKHSEYGKELLAEDFFRMKKEDANIVINLSERKVIELEKVIKTKK